jgi:hypothetical protein
MKMDPFYIRALIQKLQILQVENEIFVALSLHIKGVGWVR